MYICMYPCINIYICVYICLRTEVCIYVLRPSLFGMEAVDVGRDRLMLLPWRQVDTMDFYPVEMMLLLLKFLLYFDPASTLVFHYITYECMNK
jgi:hypothetical protein